MKKSTIFINISLVLCILLLCFRLICDIISAKVTFNSFHAFQNSEYDTTQMLSAAIEYTVLAVIEGILVAALCASLFLFNYRFDGVPLREKLAARLAESREKRAQHKAEKAAAEKQAAIEDKQKRLEELQAELDELKKE